MKRNLIFVFFILFTVSCTSETPTLQITKSIVNPSNTIAPATPQKNNPTLAISPTITSKITTPSIATPLTCWSQAGRDEYGKLETELLRQPLEYLVHLPPCYNEQPERSYPVLYLIHGQSYDQFQWQRLGASEMMDKLASSGEIAPFIIVMPRDRLWEPPNVDLFGQVVVDELIPYIDEHYRTKASREYRAIGGLSRGAGWSVHLGINDWELFGAFGAHSLALFDIDAQYARQRLREIPPDKLPRIYIDIGEKDRPNIMRSALWFEQLLTDENIPHVWNLYQGYHEEKYWGTHIEEYIRWYAADW